MTIPPPRSHLTHFPAPPPAPVSGRSCQSLGEWILSNTIFQIYTVQRAMHNVHVFFVFETSACPRLADGASALHRAGWLTRAGTCEHDHNRDDHDVGACYIPMEKT
jgi:hypothetical protein